MAFDVAELKLVGIDVRNIDTIHDYEEYLKKRLPLSEVVKDIFIDVNREKLLSDIYFFTESFMVEIPDFITFFDDRYHPKKMDFTIHPIKKCIAFCNMKISRAKEPDVRTVEVNFGLKSGTAYSFSERKENAERLEYIATTYLIPNLDTG